MGQVHSHRKKSKSKTSIVAPVQSHCQTQTETRNATKFPFPAESEMLRQIKEEYRTVSNDLDIISNTATSDQASVSVNDKRKSKKDPKVLCDLYTVALKLKRFKESSIIVSKNCEKGLKSDPNNGNGEIAYNKGSLITNFPVLVVEKLLEYLNPPAILALRLTCRITKGWIDINNRILRDFDLKIELGKDGHTNATPPNTAMWSNFSVPYVHLNSPVIQETIYFFSNIIWRLNIYPAKSINNVVSIPSNHRCLFDLINRCVQLEHLSICRLDTFTCIGDKEKYENLRVLSIDRLQWMNNSDFYTFEALIMKCPQLEYLKIPEYEILGSLAFNFYDVNVSPEKEYLIRPLIRYLDFYRSRKVDKQSIIQSYSQKEKLYIDVLEFEDFKLCSSEIFYELSRKCLECNAALMNVYFVPRDAVARNQQDIVASFASMFGFIKIDFHAELWQNLEVMECWIEDFPDDHELFLRQLLFLKTISKIETLRSFTIRLSTNDCDLCTQTLSACIGENYGGIQKLVIRVHEPNCDSYIRIPQGFGKSFTNLKYIYFQDLNSTNEDFKGLWLSLPNLEELFMYKCPYLTQDAFLSNNKHEKPSILQLRKLKVLVIFLYEGIIGFNDEFLFKTLRHMKLRGFALRGAAGVEFTDEGMVSLLNTPFHDSIEDFEAPSTFFRPSISPNYWSFYIALPKKELRKNRIWLSCSVLLNSLSSRKHSYDFKSKCLAI